MTISIALYRFSIFMYLTRFESGLRHYPAYLTFVTTYPVNGTYSSDFAQRNSYFLRVRASSIQMVKAGTFSVSAGLVHSGMASIFE